MSEHPHRRPGAGPASVTPTGERRREAHALLATAVPVAAMALVNMAMSVTDTLMAAALGPEALAAAAVGSDLYSLVFYFAIGILGGLAPLHAAAHAAADEEALRRLRSAGWAIAALVAGPASALVWMAPNHLGVIGIQPALLEAGAGYTRAMALTLLPMSAAALLRTRLTAVEQAGALFRVTLVAVPLNAVLNHALMFGVAGWPGLGLTGAGVSSFVVACVTFALYARLARRCGEAGLAPGLDLRSLHGILRLGVSIAIATLAEVGVFLGATVFVATLSVADAAAHAIGIRTAGVVYAVSLGLLQATTVRMARATSEAERRLVVTTGLVLAGGASVLLCTGLALAAGPLAMSAAGASAAMTFQVLLLLALSELFGPLGAASSGLLRGLRITRPPMLFALVGNWAVAAPLGIWLATASGLGAVGVWIGLALGSALAALLTLAFLARHVPPREAHLTAAAPA
jgi:multidrug resistance protein, MATE family